MKRRTIGVATVLLLLTAAPGIRAQPADADEQEVYVYTNADVEKLDPIPTGNPPGHATRDPEVWAFVAAFIEHEREKIDADRKYELERERVRIEADRPVGYGERYPFYPRAPYYPVAPPPPIEDDGGPDAEDAPATMIPHPIFYKTPPVREFVPGLGDSYRGRVCANVVTDGGGR